MASSMWIPRMFFISCILLDGGVPVVQSSQECEVQRPGLGMPYCADDCSEQSSVYFTGGCAEGQSCCVSGTPIADREEPAVRKAIGPFSPPHEEQTSSSPTTQHTTPEVATGNRILVGDHAHD